MKTFVEKFIITTSETELDLDYPHYEGDEANEVHIPQSKLEYTEVPSMNIDDLIKILMKFKDEGADRIYIADHVDHQGYYFYGVKLIEI